MTLNAQQFAGLPNFYQHPYQSIPDDPAYWNDIRIGREPYEIRTLAADHELHTTQEHLDPHDENVYITNPTINDEPGAPYYPEVARIPGVGDVVGHGHHRIAAAKLAGRPIKVRYYTPDEGGR